MQKSGVLVARRAENRGKLVLSGEEKIRTVPRMLVVAMVGPLLVGCDYFDAHPANVRPENEAIATVLGPARGTQIAQASPRAARAAASTKSSAPTMHRPPLAALPVHAAVPAPVVLPNTPPMPAIAAASPEAPLPKPEVFPGAPPPAIAAAPRASPAVSSASDRCAAVAKRRAEDAQAAGMGEDTRAIVRKGAYADCMAWATAHP